MGTSFSYGKKGNLNTTQPTCVAPAHGENAAPTEAPASTDIGNTPEADVATNDDIGAIPLGQAEFNAAKPPTTNVPTKTV